LVEQTIDHGAGDNLVGEGLASVGEAPVAAIYSP
jgi:hypothetical protein